MATKKHTQTRRMTFLIDAFVTLGVVAITLELATLFVSGGTFQASVYGPLRGAAENRFERQVDTTGIKAPTPKTFTACERRAMRIKNLSRRNQILTLCHARERNQN